MPEARLIHIDAHKNNALEIFIAMFEEGKVFVYPTDTIYGFGGNPFSEKAVSRLIGIKGRGEEKKFVMLADSLTTVCRYCIINDPAQKRFLDKLWPDCVTVVLNLKHEYRKILNSDTAAFRVPQHSFCRRVLQILKQPLLSTSVNRSGEPPLNELAAIMSAFGREADAVFYSETFTEGQASTIINLTGEKPELIREGKAQFAEIFAKFTDNNQNF